MLHKQTFEFLKGLEDFNDKKFFGLYKQLYLKIKGSFDNLILFLIQEISKFDDTIFGLEVRKCTFRIYKDMRFQKNRENPYKINLGANISIGGRKSELAGYYIHIQNNESFFSGGIYNPSTKVANLIRKNIYKNWNQFEKIIKNKDFIRVFGDVFSYHTPLKKLSKEFNSNQASTKYLQYKDRLINKKINNREILSGDIGNKILEYAKIAKKLNDFINNI